MNGSITINGMPTPVEFNAAATLLDVLREHGWLSQRRTGTWNWYRTVAPEVFPPGEALFEQALLAADGVDHADGAGVLDGSGLRRTRRHDEGRRLQVVRTELPAQRSGPLRLADRSEQRRGGNA